MTDDVGLRVRGAKVHFGTKRAVDGVDLAIEPGEVVAVLGPSGCGKSTLLHAIAGLEELTAGTVSYDGVDLAGQPTHKRGFAMMFQEGQLFGHTDVAGNVAFGLRIRGVTGPEAQREVAELLELVGLPGQGPRTVDTLSGGEAQRVALARSLAAHPRVLLLDEPLSALDRSLRERLAVDLRRVLTETGTTTLLVTHDHDEAFTIADRMAVMRRGVVVQEGAAGQVWRQPTDQWTARFLGVENVLNHHDATVLLDAAGGTRRFPVELDGTHMLGVRRGAIRIGSGPVRASTTAVAMGRDGLRVDVEVPGAGTLAGLADATAELTVGEDVCLDIDPSGLMIFQP